MLPISTATNTAGTPIPVPGGVELTMAITPNGKTLYVAHINYGGGGVTPVILATRKAGNFIPTGSVWTLAITPNGKTLYVGTSPKVIPISTTTNSVGKAIKLGSYGFATSIAFTPDGTMAYVASVGSAVLPIRIATNTALRLIRVGTNPDAITSMPTLASPCHLCY